MNRLVLATLIGVVISAASAVYVGWAVLSAEAQDLVQILVTSTADGDDGACPSDSACTLRAAVAAANADASGATVVITFDAGAFPQFTPATIVIGTALPTLTRANVTIDGSTAGVTIVGSSHDTGSNLNGLAVAGAGTVIRGLGIQHFSGTCLAVSGDNSVVGGDADHGEGNRVGDCGVGVVVAGDGATLIGNRVGFAPDSVAAAHVGVGILVLGSHATLGADNLGPIRANVLGNAGTAIRVGGAAASTNGTRVMRNIIGQTSGGVPAPVDVALELREPSSSAEVASNEISFATTGIAVSAGSQGNEFRQNVFHSISGLALDLNADGFANPNDEQDADDGANALVNHPVLSKAVQSRIDGSVGTTCGGCSVQLYVAAHTVGSPNDYGTAPVPGGIAVSRADGGFAFENPAVTPGQWVTALVTDSNGNTSEFGPSTRVGTGIAQCGNVTLSPGWNHVGFFGAEPLSLGDDFPMDGPGTSSVTAIYHLRDGSPYFDHWFNEPGAGRTLDTLIPGEAYWFYATDTVALNDGFSLAVPLPLQLKAGWNDVVYIGAPADVRDALASLRGNYRDVYQWSLAGDDGGRWAAWGEVDTPTWARDFTELRACASYELFVTEDSELLPLQP